MSSLSRFNPKTGMLDFWHEFRKPNPLRWPILAASTLPLVVILYWVSGETVYTKPERPVITYIETFPDGRSDEEIIASNEANQEVKDLRQAAIDEAKERKRNAYKALGRGMGMDVDRIAEEADARRAKEEAEAQAERKGMFDDAGETAQGAAEDDAPADSASTKKDLTPQSR